MSDDSPTDKTAHSNSTTGSSLSRRSVLALGALGLSGLTAGSGVVAGDTSEPRPWKQDVDANGHDLLDLGSVSMSANPTAVTDFEGNNLEIDGGTLTTEIDDFAGDNLSIDSGVLNADAGEASPWEDTDSDGLLETPDHDGIGITDAEIQNLSETYYASTFGEDGAAIQQALDAVGTDPGVVIIDAIEASPYVVSDPPITVPSNTRLVFQEQVRREARNGSGTPPNVFETAGYASETDDDANIHFVGEGGGIDGNSDQRKGSDGERGNCIGLLGSHLSVRNLQLENANFHGINCKGGSSGVTVVGNRFVGNNFAGLQCHWRTSDNAGGERVIAAHNVIINRNDQAGSAGFWMSGFKTYTLANNYIRHNDRGILVSNGDAAAPANNISVTGNVIEDTTRRGREGILVSASSISRPDQGTADMEDVTVSDNAMRNTGGLRIEAGEQNVKNVSAVGNTIRDSMGHGIEVTNEQGGEVIGATLQGNSIDNPAGSGITLLANGAAVKHLSVADNSIANASERGIVLLSSSGGTTKDVILKGNTINTTAQFAGIQIGLPANEDTAVVGNTVRNAEFSGMNISGTHGTVVGNVLVANGKHGITIGDPNHIFKGNLCKANEDSGISMNAGENIVVGNRCLDNGTYGITRSSGLDNNVITNNIVRGNSSSGIGGSAGSNSVVTNNIT